MRVRLSLLVLLTFLTPALAQGVSITDALQRSIKLEKRPERIAVTLHYDEITAVAGVEGWKRVVVMSRAPWESWRPAIYAQYLKAIPALAAIPDTGDIEDGSFAAEKVIAARPDVLVLSKWGYETSRTQIEKIENAGIPVVVLDYHAQELEKHIASTRVLGAVFNADKRAEEISAHYRQRYQDTLARVAKARSRKPAAPKVYVEFGREGAETIGNSYNNAMWGQVIKLLGANNIAENRIPGPWGPISAETVLKENPDAIFIASSSWITRPKAVKTGYGIEAGVTRASLAPYTQRPGWNDLKAVINGNIHAVEHGLCRSLLDFTAMQYIAKRLYPEEFSDVDPEKSLREYHEKFLPVEYSGTWFLQLKP